ncbi:MAG TPA: hypothetical protein VEX68_11245 [Bryobacteraceae bacterium]|nr:hypothetical protein [Bryobacteraceae bacterium]
MFHKAVITVVEAFESLNIPYAIGGSVASSVRGIARATNDVDFIASLALRRVDQFAEKIRPDFYADEDHIRASLEHRRPFNVIHMPTAFKIDIFPATEAFHYAQLEQSTLATFGFFGEQLTCRVVSSEDIVLAKLRWFNESGRRSEQQWRDVSAVLTASSTRLDREYLDQWAQKLGLSELLEKAINESQI